MKVTDYIVDFFIKKGVTDCFGYPGGVICHFIDSVSKRDEITAHVNYNEQGAAFSACGYAQCRGRLGLAFSTSGPGATNLITGIANAFFDSIPCIFITGQVDTYALSNGFPVRQRGFQETNIMSITKDISKWSVCVDDPKDIRFCLEKAYHIAISDNPGPVVLDIPADIQRADVDIEVLNSFIEPKKIMNNYFEISKEIYSALSHSKRPVIVAGNGIKQSGMKTVFRAFVEHIQIPVVMSLPAFDLLSFDHNQNYGFIGTNGQRYANFLLGKSDLILSIGSRLDIRQIGLSRDTFAPQAKLIRVDIDGDALHYLVHKDEKNYCADVRDLLPELFKFENSCDYSEWSSICKKTKDKLIGYDDREYNTIIKQMSDYLPDRINFVTDVGQHQLWFAQSIKIKENQNVYMSAGHGAMGYALPAAIGIYYASKKIVVAICGDGGFMMNLQELQFIKRDNLPIKILCINNSSLGMIRGFQERNFDGNYQLTTESSGYLPPDIEKIAEAFDIKYSYVESIEDIKNVDFSKRNPEIIEVKISSETVLEPNFGRTGQIQDQLPYISRDIYNELMSL